MLFNDSKFYCFFAVFEVSVNILNKEYFSRYIVFRDIINRERKRFIEPTHLFLLNTLQINILSQKFYLPILRFC